MCDQKLYDIKVLVARMARAISVNGVTAEAAHEVAGNMCAAWGRRVPGSMEDIERWAAELEESGAYEFESDEIKILVKRSA